MPDPDTPVPWRLRSDLEIEPAERFRLQAWTIKDPLRLSYFRVEAEELAFLKLLDGRRPLSAVASDLERQFPGSTFSTINLRMFLNSAISGSLLRSTQPGFGSRLAAVARQQQSAATFRRLFSILTHRFRGVDPSGVLKWLHETIGWVYQTWFLRLCMAVILAAVMMVVPRLEQLKTELPQMTELAAGGHIPLLLVAIIVVKVLHEIGHGLTCHHFGGECHELGILVVGFLPLLYCDVSDSWLQQDRHRRIFVASAGIAVELILAATCGILWAISNPGPLHALFLNIFLVCSLNTLLINGNPLMRYDGYYVASDLLRIPNLSSESRGCAGAWFDRVVLGIPRLAGKQRSVAADIGLTGFAVASSVYRILMVATLLFVMQQLLRPFGMELVAGLLSATVLLGFLVSLVQGVRRRFADVGHSLPGRLRALGGVSVLAMLVIGLLWVPFPHHVSAPFTLEPGTAVPIYVTVPGHAEPLVSLGDQIEAGTAIARLHNAELDLLTARTAGDMRLAETRIAGLRSRRAAVPASATALPAAVKAAAATRARLDTLTEKSSHLTIRSPVSGIVLSAREIPRPGWKDRNQGAWFGNPLDHANGTVWVEEQTLLCWVGQYTQLRATCLVAQQDVEFVLDQAEAELVFRSVPSRPRSGHVVHIHLTPEVAVSRELVATRQIPTIDPRSGIPAETLYSVQVQLNPMESEPQPPLYATGSARIQCPPMSLAERIWRLICHTFAFRL